jgi:hypothetical protein
MTRQPTAAAATSLIRRFCVASHEFNQTRAEFAAQKKALNKTQRSLQSALRDILSASEDGAIPVAPNVHVVLATMFTAKPITLDVVRAALGSIPGEIAPPGLAKAVNKARMKPSPYAKIVNGKLPKGKHVNARSGRATSLAALFHRAKGDLASIRKREKDALSDRRKELASIEGKLLRQAWKRKKPLRINFKDGDGLVRSYFLKKRAKKRTGRLTKKRLLEAFDRVTLDRGNPNLANEIFAAIQAVQKKLVSTTETFVLHRGRLSRG